MPNHVTNRLEINADSETVQKVLNFLRGENEEGRHALLHRL